MDIYSMCPNLLNQSLLLRYLLRIIHDLIFQVASFQNKAFYFGSWELWDGISDRIIFNCEWQKIPTEIGLNITKSIISCRNSRDSVGSGCSNMSSRRQDLAISLLCVLGESIFPSGWLPAPTLVAAVLGITFWHVNLRWKNRGCLLFLEQGTISQNSPFRSHWLELGQILPHHWEEERDYHSWLGSIFSAVDRNTFSCRVEGKPKQGVIEEEEHGGNQCWLVSLNESGLGSPERNSETRIWAQVNDLEGDTMMYW